MQRQRRRALITALCVGTAAAALTVPASLPAGAATQTLTFTATADTYVGSDAPTTTHGTATKLYVDRTPTKRTYVRFTVAGLGSGVTASSATFKIYAASSLSAGFDLRTTTATWSESTLSYSNEPASSLSPVLASSAAVATGQWVSVPLPASLPVRDGTPSIVLSARSDTALALNSRETAQKPTLVVTADTGSTATAPVSTAPPTIAGSATVGSTLTASPGTWSGATPITYGYQWQRCQSTCASISGAAASTYVVTAADVGASLAVTVTARNSVGSSTATSARTATVATTSSSPVVAAAGDIACDPLKSTYNGGAGTSDNCHMKATSDLLVGKPYAAVLALGDNQNFCGSIAAYRASYDPTWGRVKAITRPVPGNHEYITNGDPATTTGCDASNAGAAGYFTYFGAAAGTPGQGWYSYDLGAWHIIALNSNCGDAGGCGPTSPQGQWLSADLKAHPNLCTLAYWHIPLFSSGGRAAQNSKSFWQALYAAGVEVVLDGHDHIYERFNPMTPDGALDTAHGIREFIVGTGGENHTSIATVAPNSAVRNASTYGVLQLTLNPTSYDWKFVPEAGKTFTDSGSAACH